MQAQSGHVEVLTAFDELIFSLDNFDRRLGGAIFWSGSLVSVQSASPQVVIGATYAKTSTKPLKAIAKQTSRLIVPVSKGDLLIAPFEISAAVWVLYV